MSLNLAEQGLLTHYRDREPTQISKYQSCTKERFGEPYKHSSKNSTDVKETLTWCFMPITFKNVEFCKQNT